MAAAAAVADVVAAATAAGIFVARGGLFHAVELLSLGRDSSQSVERPNNKVGLKCPSVHKKFL